MRDIIDEIREAVNASYPLSPDNALIENWRVRMRIMGVSTKALEVLLNFFMKDDREAAEESQSTDGFIPVHQVNVNIDQLLERISELEDENARLRNENEELKDKLAKKKRGFFSR